MNGQKIKFVSKLLSPWLPGLMIGIFFSCDNSKPEINQQNLRRINKGMRMEKVETIMGKPDSILLFGNENYWYVFDAPFGMSDNFYIFISKKDSIVVGINDGL